MIRKMLRALPQTRFNSLGNIRSGVVSSKIQFAYVVFFCVRLLWLHAQVSGLRVGISFPHSSHTRAPSANSDEIESTPSTQQKKKWKQQFEASVFCSFCFQDCKINISRFLIFLGNVKSGSASKRRDTSNVCSFTKGVFARPCTKSIRRLLYWHAPTTTALLHQFQTKPFWRVEKYKNIYSVYMRPYRDTL